MTRGTGATALLCALLAATTASCGIPPNGPAARHAKARIRAILSDMKDLPAGFSDRPRDPWRPPFRAKERSCRELLNAAAGRFPGDGVVASAGATYQGDGLGETAALRITEFSGMHALLVLEHLTVSIHDCSSARGTHAGGADRLKASALAIESDGDVEATQMRGRVGGYPYEIQLAFTRSGGTLISLAHTGIAAPDPRRTEELVRLVRAKVENAP
jgi:hypothetical protein